MGKIKLIFLISSIAGILIIGIIVKQTYDDRNYYKDAHELNRNLNADGLKLMMTIEEVSNVYGNDGVFNEGFGGDFYEYPSNGVAFSVSTDSDYDLFKKVGDLSISSAEYSIFGIFIGDKESDASEILISKGYKEKISSYGDKTYIKGCVNIDFSVNEEVVTGLKIYVKDKNYDPDRIY